MKIPIVQIKGDKTKELIQGELDVIVRIISYFIGPFSKAFEIEMKVVEDYVNEALADKKILNYCIIRSVEDTNIQFFQTIKTYENYVAAPGTILNAVFLYVLIRHFKLKSIFESGTASGFYTSFLVAAAIKNGGDFNIDTVDILPVDDIGKNILFDSPNIHVHKGTNSLDFLKDKNEKKLFYDLYCHDSQHTFNHMMKELIQFKKCEKDCWYSFYDDQRSENFWNRCISMKLFDKPGYSIKLTNEETQLGGFLEYRRALC